MKCILVVDDSTTNLKFVESVLKDYYRLILVKSGEQALKYLAKKQVDLVLLDLLMPEMDGFETYEEIKKLGLNKDVPVVFLTADADVESEIRGLKMGAIDFIRKPFVPEVILNRINRLLRLEELNRELEAKVDEKTMQVEQLSFEIIATIASMIEARDSYTKGHSVRVAEYSALIAEKLGWSDSEIQKIKYIALLHDIGKVGIPDSVLNKPGKLTEQEFDIIKSHTTIGGDILKDIETIADVDSGAKYHHERYDGKGYPCGLKGNEIPDVARIICITDAYDAMNSKRVYRDSLSPAQIRRELINGRGTQFDPEYTDIFIGLLDEGRLTHVGEEEEKERTISGDSSHLINQIMKSIEEETKRNEATDYLTGLPARKGGESRIKKAVSEKPGYLAFIDLDNLKRTNDTMGHLAGDYALMTVGQVLREFDKDAIMARIGGDEFLYYVSGVDEDGINAIAKSMMESFEDKKKQSTYLSVSSLSMGICATTPDDSYQDLMQKADKALYYIKQRGKCGYYIYSDEADNAIMKTSIDLELLVSNLKAHGSYSGALNVEYREFAKLYDFIQHLVERYDYNMQLIMLTLESTEAGGLDIDEHEYAMACMEKTIQASLRAVDVSTRFSSDQFLVILLNAQTEDISIIMNRIYENFSKICKNKSISLNYDIAELVKPDGQPGR